MRELGSGLLTEFRFRKECTRLLFFPSSYENIAGTVKWVPIGELGFFLSIEKQIEFSLCVLTFIAICNNLKFAKYFHVPLSSKNSNLVLLKIMNTLVLSQFDCFLQHLRMSHQNRPIQPCCRMQGEEWDLLPTLLCYNYTCNCAFLSPNTRIITSIRPHSLSCYVEPQFIHET